jgi:hypothetical protein
MRLTRGERWALVLYAVVLVGFLPPVTVWANGVEARIFGMPFLLAWNAAMVFVTAVVMTAAFVVKDRLDR